MAPSNAPKSSRPLGVLVVIVVALVATMFGTGTFVPKLGLDLSGGTTVTLTPVTQQGKAAPEDSVEKAVEIIRQRVNALGVSEAEVTKQSDNIVVSVPGEGQREVVEKIGQTAQLRFRQVLLAQPVGQGTQPTPSQSPSGQPSGDRQDQKDQQGSGSDQGSGSSDSSGSSDGGGSTESSAAGPEQGAPSQSRAISEILLADAASQPDEPDKQGGQGGSRQDQQGSQSGGSNPQQSLSPEQRQQLLQRLQQQQGAAQQKTSDIDKDVLKKFRDFECEEGAGRGRLLPTDEQVVACDQEGTVKYVLGRATLLGTAVSDAQAGLPGQGQTGGWMVQLTFNGKGAKQFGDITQRVTSLQPPRNQVAIVLDGLVRSAPRIESAIPGGTATITGNFTQASASDLATILRYGALPLKFEKSEIQSISPTLGAQQLRAGLIAGGLGLLLVLLYALLYYRGLGLVITASLVIAASLSYSAVVLLGIAMGYRLSLPGVTGLIVSIGITADSFVVYFERLRDEVREGRTLRTAVERGWERARRTVITADVVQFLAAVVLYTLAVGGVKGFAFTLGITTLIDVLVVFMFTKPLLTLLARTRFFGDGHALSGLDPTRLGARSAATTPRRSSTTTREA